MENERTFFAPRKIRVVGCLNCPYYTPKRTINWKGESEIQKTKEAHCHHPSFKHSVDILPKEGFLYSAPGYPPYFIPDWCPLEFETCDVCAK